MEELEILYNHYKETCTIDNNSIVGLIQSWFKGNYNCDLLFSSNIIQAVLWIVLLFSTLRYLGLNINLDRSYSYIHQLEKRINKISSNPIIAREGESYLRNYPVLNNITYYMYRVVIPIIYNFVIIYKLKLEYIAQQEISIFVIFQTIIGILCIALLLTYLIENIVEIITDIINKYKKSKKTKIKNNKKIGDKNKKKT